jgi:hypothetical protein
LKFGGAVEGLCNGAITEVKLPKLAEARVAFRTVARVQHSNPDTDITPRRVAAVRAVGATVMAVKDDFCGERLRLTAFLRIAEKMPQRPARFRRALVEAEQKQSAEHSSTQLHAPADHSPRAANVSDQQDLLTESTEGCISGVCRHLRPDTSLDEMDSPGTGIPSHNSHHLRASLNMRVPSAERPQVSCHARTPLRTRPVVYSVHTAHYGEFRAPGKRSGFL